MLRFYIGILIPLSILVPLGVAIFRYRLLPSPAISIFIYLVLSGCANGIAIVMARNGMNNLPLLHFYTVLEFIVLALFFRQVMPHRLAKIIPYLLSAFAAYCIINAIAFQSVFTYNTYPRALEALLLIISALSVFYKMLSGDEDLPWFKNPVTFFNIGLLFYFSGSLSLFLLSQALLKNAYLNQIAWVVHATLVFLMYMLFAAGFLQCKRGPQMHRASNSSHERNTLATS